MRVLVAFASKNGSTEEIARRIAAQLGRGGLEVDCAEAGTVGDLGPYQAVVLGSAVYAKRWQPSARRFLRRHEQSLRTLPLWVFSSGPVGEPKEGARTDAWLEPPKTMARVEGMGARAHVVFGGRVPREPHNFIERAMTKNTPAEFADRRDWVEITDWAADIAAELQTGKEEAAAS